MDGTKYDGISIRCITLITFKHQEQIDFPCYLSPEVVFMRNIQSPKVVFMRNIQWLFIYIVRILKRRTSNLVLIN